MTEITTEVVEPFVLDLQAIHHPYSTTIEGHKYEFCVGCGGAWPCSTDQLISAYSAERLRPTKVTENLAQMQADLTERVLKEIQEDEDSGQFKPTLEQLDTLIPILESVDGLFRQKLDYLVLMGVATATQLGGISAATKHAARALRTIRLKKRGKK